MSTTGLPHYKNNTAGMNKYEPVYLNLFDVTIVPPAAVSGWELVMEHVEKVGGLEVEKLPPSGVEQKYKGATRRYANALPESTTIDVTLDFSVNLDDKNSMYVYNALRSWCDLIFDPLTGSMSLKKDYAGGPMVISIHNRKGEIFRQYKMPVVWPTTPLTAIDLDYSTGSGFYTIANFTLAADYWEDISQK